MKQCTKCGETKPLDEFSKEKRNKSGISSWCSKCKSEAERKHRAANPEKVCERERKWKAANLEKVREQERKRYAANPEKVRESVRKWDAANPEKVLTNSRNRRALKKGNGGKITATEWQWLKEFYDFACLRCGKKEPEIKLELDHVIPLKLGGKNVIENAQPLCRSCNSSKGAKHIDYRKERNLL